jgi:hypothetical protein
VKKSGTPPNPFYPPNDNGSSHSDSAAAGLKLVSETACRIPRQILVKRRSIEYLGTILILPHGIEKLEITESA